ncbi:hypothetical protein AHAS_Ahas03G0219700, partial [Arachis hypogaea]
MKITKGKKPAAASKTKKVVEQVIELRSPDLAVPARDLVRFANRYCAIQHEKFWDSKKLHIKRELKMNELPSELWALVNSHIRAGVGAFKIEN